MIFTFYSFKGGVGRSMAMAAVAYELAKRGLRVLAIDFDLEAPGLERYFFESGRALQVRQHPGLIDLLNAYKRALTSEAEFREARFKKWWTFVEEAIPHAIGGDGGTRSGSVDIMIAGQREPEVRLQEYASAVRSFDWFDFFHNWKGEQFFAWLRDALVVNEPSAEQASVSLTRGYDVVLIDSRTGVTEMGGVCAYQLADAVVMLCSANDQSIDGTLAVAKDFQSDTVQAVRRGRPLELLVLPARLEESNERREEFLRRFESKFECSVFLPSVLSDVGLSYRKLALPYVPELAVIERLVGDEDSVERDSSRKAIQSFELLADALTLLTCRPGRLQKQQDAVRARLRGSGSQGSSSIEQIADPTARSSGFDAILQCGSRYAVLGRRVHKVLVDAGLSVWFEHLEKLSRPDGWKQQAETVYEVSATLVVMVGNGRTPERLRRIITRARERGRPRIIPILLEHSGTSSRRSPARRLANLGLSAHLYVMLDPSASASDEQIQLQIRPAVDAIRSGLRKQKHPSWPASQPARDPYPGVRAFAEDDAAFFFGRREETDALIGLAKSSPTTLLIGPAGVGKTSLLCAGLMPELRRNDFSGAPGNICYIDCSLPAGEPQLAELVELNADKGRIPAWVLIDSVDSFPLGSSSEAVLSRINRVAGAIEATRGSSSIVLSLRDTLDAPAREFAWKRWGCNLPDKKPSEMRLEPMEASAVLEAIEKPAATLGHVLDPGLAQLLIDNAGSLCSGMAQIARVLPLLWQERRRGWVTTRAYESNGGLRGVFERAVTEAYAGLSKSQRPAFDALIWSMTQFDAAMQLTSAPARWQPMASIAEIGREDAVALRDQMAERHLIDLWRPPNAASNTPGEPARGDVTIALVHGSARYYGPRYTQPPDAAFLLWRGTFCPLAYRWEAAGRDRSALLSGAALSEGRDYVERHPDLLSAPEREFLGASIAAQKREERRLQVRATRQKIQLRVVSGFLVLTVGLAVTAFWQRYIAERASQATIRESRDKDTYINYYQATIATLNAEKLRNEALKQQSDLSAAQLNSTSSTLRLALANGKNQHGIFTSNLLAAIDTIDTQASNLSQTAGDSSATDAKPATDTKPRLYIQIGESEQRAVAEKLRQRLAQVGPSGQVGVIVPPVEVVLYSSKKSVVRCFRELECRNEGREIVDRINSLLQQPRIALQDLSSRYPGATAPRHFELWVAPGPITLKAQ
jgi:MinD-like ATPase involved in chromosome partitioning or flagellar assembly